MAKLTDQLKRRSVRSLVNSDMPEWWPAAQIVAAGFLVVALLVMGVSHFGRKNPESAAPLPSQSGPTVTAAPATGLGPAPTTASTSPQPQDTTPTEEPGAAKGMPTTVDATTVAVRLADGSTKAVPLASWLAARDKLAATYPSSQPTAVWLLSSSGASNTFSVELSNPQDDSIVVQVTAVLQGSGLWAAG